MRRDGEISLTVRGDDDGSIGQPASHSFIVPLIAKSNKIEFGVLDTVDCLQFAMPRRSVRTSGVPLCSHLFWWGFWIESLVMVMAMASVKGGLIRCGPEVSTRQKHEHGYEHKHKDGTKGGGRMGHSGRGEGESKGGG